VSSEAIIRGSAAFLAPETGIVPLSSVPPRMRMRSMASLFPGGSAPAFGVRELSVLEQARLRFKKMRPAERTAHGRQRDANHPCPHVCLACPPMLVAPFFAGGGNTFLPLVGPAGAARTGLRLAAREIGPE